MGTNYYAHKCDPCPTCKKGGEEWHIGKKSFGWQFLFASYPHEGITSAAEWREVLKYKIIRSEYGDTMLFTEFWNTVVRPGQSNPDNSCGGRSDSQGFCMSDSWDFS